MPTSFFGGAFFGGEFFSAAQQKAGGIVKYRHYEQEENDRLALIQYQRKRRDAMIEDEDVLAIVIAIAGRMMH